MDLAELLLAYLDPDGEPSINQKLRLSMSKAARRRISDEEFYAARDPLLKKGIVGRLPGQGGKTFLVTQPPDPEVEDPAPTTNGKVWSEAALMGPLGAYLIESFGPALELPKLQCIVQDTSKTGPPTGHWERPDYVLVAVSSFRHLPGVQVDVHSFELKTEPGGGLQGVHEALGHTRRTDFGYLVWHLPIGSKFEQRLRAVEHACLEHGIGLILMRNPEDSSLTEVLLDARRRRTERHAVDEFLHLRLTKTSLDRVAEARQAFKL
jgi:hypothetical protein